MAKGALERDEDAPSTTRAPGICALLPWFDAPLLGALGVSEAELDRLHAGGALEPAGDPPGALCLREELREAALDALRQTDPDAELAVHGGAFDAFLARLEAGHAHATANAAQLFHHLDRLFYMLAPRYDWAAIEALLARVPEPQPAAQHYLLVFYRAWIALHRGQHPEAEAPLLAALDDPGVDDGLRARLLNALALSEMGRNAYPLALRHFDAAYKAAAAAGSLYFQGAALVNMSMLLNDLGDFAASFRLCQQGLAIFERMRDPRRQAIVLYELGNNALNLGRWNEARDYLGRAVAMAQGLGLEARLIHAYWCQGLLHFFLAEFDACERLYNLALERADAFASDPSLARDIRWHLGVLFASQGRLDEALAAFDQALADETRLHWQSVISYQRGRVFERRGDTSAARAAYHQAIVTLERLSERTDDEQVKIQLLSTTSQLYEAMVLLCVAEGPSAWPDALLYVERARSRAFLDSMAHRAPELFPTFQQPVAMPAELQLALPADALLIEYFTTGVVPRGEHAVARLAADGMPLAEQLLLPPRILIFAVTTTDVRVIEAPLSPNDLPTLDEPEASVQRLLRPAMLEDLYASLVAPVDELLAGRRVLYVVPHGPLHHVPFGALLDATGMPLLRADGPALALAPSATILLRSALGRPRAPRGTALALGYNHGGRELRYAEGEAALAAQLLGGQARTGPAPKSEALLTEARTARLLHIACHADYDPLDPLATVLHLGADDQLSARAIVERLALRCDLVTLSACTSGLSKVISGDELLGLPRALLYAGAPSVICTLWEADDCVALLITYFLYGAMAAGVGPAAALRDAQAAVRALTGREVLALFDELRGRWPASLATLPSPEIHPDDMEHAVFSEPYAWAPFMLIGRPD